MLRNGVKRENTSKATQNIGLSKSFVQKGSSSDSYDLRSTKESIHISHTATSDRKRVPFATTLKNPYWNESHLWKDAFLVYSYKHPEDCLGPPINKSDKTIRFNSRFESGNLLYAYRLTPDTYHCILEYDHSAASQCQWFYFQMSNIRTVSNCNRKMTFYISGFNKASGVFSTGSKVFMYSEKLAKEKNIGWFRTGTDYAYGTVTSKNDDSFLDYEIDKENNKKKKGANKQHKLKRSTLQFQISFPYDDDVVYLCYAQPYTFTDLNTYITNWIRTSPSLITKSTLCKTNGGKDCPLLTITAPNSPSASNKKCIFITARIHPGESNGSIVLHGLIDYLLSKQPLTTYLLDHFVFKIVPMVNIDGVIEGFYRVGLEGEDLNRVWNQPDPRIHPVVYHTKNLIYELNKKMGIAAYIDFHGHSREHGTFAYGCPWEEYQNLPQSMINKEKVLPKIISSLCDAFSFEKCVFSIPQKRKDASRCVIRRELGIVNSFTIESSFGGIPSGLWGNTLYNEFVWKEIGAKIGEGLFHLFSDPSSQTLKTAEKQIAAAATALIKPSFSQIDPQPFKEKPIIKKKINRSKSEKEENKIVIAIDTQDGIKVISTETKVPPNSSSNNQSVMNSGTISNLKLNRNNTNGITVIQKVEQNPSVEAIYTLKITDLSSYSSSSSPSPISSSARVKKNPRINMNKKLNSTLNNDSKKIQITPSNSTENAAQNRKSNLSQRSNASLLSSSRLNEIRISSSSSQSNLIQDTNPILITTNETQISCSNSISKVAEMQTSNLNSSFLIDTSFENTNNNNSILAQNKEENQNQKQTNEDLDTNKNQKQINEDLNTNTNQKQIVNSNEELNTNTDQKQTINSGSKARNNRIPKSSSTSNTNPNPNSNSNSETNPNSNTKNSSEAISNKIIKPNSNSNRNSNPNSVSKTKLISKPNANTTTRVSIIMNPNQPQAPEANFVPNPPSSRNENQKPNPHASSNAAKIAHHSPPHSQTPTPPATASESQSQQSNPNIKPSQSSNQDSKTAPQSNAASSSSSRTNQQQISSNTKQVQPPNSTNVKPTPPQNQTTNQNPHSKVAVNSKQNQQQQQQQQQAAPTENTKINQATNQNIKSSNVKQNQPSSTENVKQNQNPNVAANSKPTPPPSTAAKNTNSKSNQPQNSTANQNVKQSQPSSSQSNSNAKQNQPSNPTANQNTNQVQQPQPTKNSNTKPAQPSNVESNMKSNPQQETTKSQNTKQNPPTNQAAPSTTTTTAKPNTQTNTTTKPNTTAATTNAPKPATTTTTKTNQPQNIAANQITKQNSQPNATPNTKSNPQSNTTTTNAATKPNTQTNPTPTTPATNSSTKPNTTTTSSKTTQPQNTAAANQNTKQNPQPNTAPQPPPTTPKPTTTTTTKPTTTTTATKPNTQTNPTPSTTTNTNISPKPNTQPTASTKTNPQTTTTLKQQPTPQTTTNQPQLSNKNETQKPTQPSNTTQKQAPTKISPSPSLSKNDNQKPNSTTTATSNKIEKSNSKAVSDLTIDVNTKQQQQQQPSNIDQKQTTPKPATTYYDDDFGSNSYLSTQSDLDSFGFLNQEEPTLLETNLFNYSTATFNSSSTYKSPTKSPKSSPQEKTQQKSQAIQQQKQKKSQNSKTPKRK